MVCELANYGPRTFGELLNVGGPMLYEISAFGSRHSDQPKASPAWFRAFSLDRDIVISVYGGLPLKRTAHFLMDQKASLHSSSLKSNYLAKQRDPTVFNRFGGDILISMSEGATRKDIDEVIDIMKDFMSQVAGQFNEVNHQFDEVNRQFDEVNRQFDEVNKRLDRFDRDYDHLINTIDSFIGRIDKYEIELAARDSQFEKLLAWARKVSEKTGIPLENL